MSFTLALYERVYVLSFSPEQEHLYSTQKGKDELRFLNGDRSSVAQVRIQCKGHVESSVNTF